MHTITRAEAKAEGSADYFTGKPCPKGHIAKRKTANGECRECARLYAEAKHDLKRDDVEYRAKNAARANAHYARKEEPKRTAKRALADAARISHPHLIIRSRDEAVSLGLSRYFHGRPCTNGHISERETGDRACVECKRAITATWRTDNKPHTRDYNRAYYARDPEGACQRAADWKRENPDWVKVQTHKRRCRLLSAEGSHTIDDLKDIRAKQGDRCAYCRKSLNGKGHLDHIKPLARGGSNWPKNLQFLCQPCNSSKLALDPIDFAQSIGLLL